MSFFKIGNMGLILSANGASTIDLTPPDPPLEGLELVDVAEYVDTSGVLQTVTADADTTPAITGVAPFTVWFDASDTRSEAVTTEGAAYTGNNYRFDSGEGISGNWPLSGQPKNIVEGAPVVGHVFTIPGTHTVTRRGRDPEGRQGTVSFTVTVTAPGAGTTISEGGSWPTWVDDGVYYLAAGTNHTAKGPVVWSGRRGIRLIKSGVGANPVISGLEFDTRHVVETVVTRTRNCATWGIDIPQLTDAPVGHLYCSIVDNGIPMTWVPTSLDYWWLTGASSTTAKNNICYNRGTALWGVAEINSNGTNYPFLGGGKNMTFRDVDFNKDAGGTDSHVFRGGSDGLDLRFNRFRSAVAVSSYNKIHGWNNGTTFDTWHPLDRWGLAGTGQYRPVCRKIAIEHNVYGAAGSNNSVATNIEACPENNDGSIQAVELVSIQNNVWYVSSWVGWSIAMSGRNILHYNNRLNLGAGSEAPYVTGAGTSRLATTPPGWDGPYVNAARPEFDT